MRRYLFLLIVFSAFIFSQLVKAQQPIPYLYYYSDKENAFVIEHADGTDRHLFAKNEIPKKDHIGIDGSGWSPDGQWFAWITTYSADGIVYRNGHVISIDGQKKLGIIRNIKNMYQMHWSPDSKYLLLNLNPYSCKSQMSDCYTDTYWFVDVSQDSILAIFDIGQQRSRIGVEWVTDKRAVVLYIWEDAWGQPTAIGYHRVTMHSDGRVEKQPITQEEWKANIPPDDLSSTTDTKSLPSPSGKYTIELSPIKASVLKNLTDNTSITFPSSKFGSQNTMTPVNAIWSADEEWVMAGYADFNGVYGTAIFKRDGTQYREINTCGSSPACVGWLPENVDVTKIGFTP